MRRRGGERTRLGTAERAVSDAGAGREERAGRRRAEIHYVDLTHAARLDAREEDLHTSTSIPVQCIGLHYVRKLKTTSNSHLLIAFTEEAQRVVLALLAEYAFQIPRVH